MMIFWGICMRGYLRRDWLLVVMGMKKMRNKDKEVSRNYQQITTTKENKNLDIH